MSKRLPNGPIFERRNLIDKERAYVMWCQGKTDLEIGEEFGVCETSVGAWRRKNKLKPNKPRPGQPKRRLSKNMSKLSQEAAAARRAGMNYGTWKAGQWEAAGRPKYRRGSV